jgi:hypothetical protein
MIEGTFDIVFRGQIIKSVEIEEVKTNLAALFKSSPEDIDKLFTGNEVSIKRGLDYMTAMKYQSSLKKAGALALIKEVVDPKKASTAETSSAPPVVSKVNTSETSVEATSTDDSPTLADLGTNIIPEKVYEKKEIDTSGLTLAPVGERIMPPKEPDNTPPPSIDHLSLE